MAETGQEEEEHTSFPLKRDFPADEAIPKSHEDEVNKKQKLSPTTDDDDDDEDEDEDDGDDSSLAQLNEIEEEDDGDEDDYEGEEEEDDEEAEVDRKGKGILRDDKGKGKLIEESDSTDSGNESDTDLSDDLLAEVDLANIIPSRTRRRNHQSGLKISDDPVKPDGTDA